VPFVVVTGCSKKESSAPELRNTLLLNLNPEIDEISLEIELRELSRR
jgi:hypothetical protein